MRIALISSSLSPNSRSRHMLSDMKTLLEKNGANTDWLDLRDTKMEFCDARKTSYGEDIEAAKSIMDNADGIIFAYGVYCYSIPGVLKNFIDISCEAMSKPFGQVIASGGNNAFLSHEHLSQILVNEVHAPAYPHVIFASYPEYPGGEITNEKLKERMKDYAEDFVRWVEKLRG